MYNNQDLGFTSQSQTLKNVFPAEDKPRPMKKIIVKVGEGLLVEGSLLAREKSSGKHRALKLAVAKTNESLALNPTNPEGVKFVSTAMVSGPIVPGTVVLTGMVSAAMVTMTDNSNGLLFENLNKAMGFIDYGTKQVGINTVAAMVSSDSFTAAYKTFGDSGNLDLEDIVVLPCEVDATDDDIDIRAVEGGIINPDDTNPVIDETDRNIFRVFQKTNKGFSLEPEV